MTGSAVATWLSAKRMFRSTPVLALSFKSAGVTPDAASTMEARAGRASA
ncbi:MULTISPECIES: hypothetical protein [unclassified Synechococcus]|nr:MULTISPECIES: hypothetical protein [unclassified Synechococcus]